MSDFSYSGCRFVNYFLGDSLTARRYTGCCVVQVVLLLYIANWLVHLLWRRASDPDNSAIPYLTAAGDLLGTVLLALAFFILSLISDRHKVKVFYRRTTPPQFLFIYQFRNVLP